MHSDVFLLSRASLMGDRKAFSKLVKAYQSPIRRLFYNLTDGDEELSKDLAQDTFIKAWLSIGSFNYIAKFSTWLYRISYNVFCDYMRTKKPVFNVEFETLTIIMADDSTVKDFDIDFEKAIQILKTEERTAILLYYMEDQTINNISKIMNCPAGTIKSHLHRGKEKLGKYFSNDKL